MDQAPRNMIFPRLPNILRLFATKTLYIAIEVEVISSSCYNRSLEFLPRLGFYTTKFIYYKCFSLTVTHALFKACSVLSTRDIHRINKVVFLLLPIREPLESSSTIKYCIYIVSNLTKLCLRPFLRPR